MSDPNENLILQLDFEEVRDNMVEDASDQDHDATLQGASPPQLVPDEFFGACLSFGGTDAHLSLPDLGGDYAQGLTLEAWVFYTAFQGWSRIIELGNGPAADNIVLANPGTKPDLALHVFREGVPQPLQAPGVLRLNEWTHVAATIAPDSSALLYVNGQVVARGTVNLPATKPRRVNYIGRSAWAENAYFKGRMASVRVYSRALSAEEIGQDMEEDRTAAASFKSVAPLDFDLHDDQEHQVLYIAAESSEGQNLHAEVTNSSRRALQFSRQGEQPGADNHHFELRFRPGTLAPTSLDTIALAQTDWLLSTVGRDDGSASLYFLGADGASLSPGARVRLTLQHVSADAGGGARGTRVELKYRQLRYADSAGEVSGTRVQHLSVVSQAGEKNIPLHVGFVDSNRVLNDGSTPNDLKLRIANLRTDRAIPLGTSAQTPTRFVISLDAQGAGESKEWALATASQAAGVELHWGLLATLAAPAKEQQEPYLKPGTLAREDGQEVPVYITATLYVAPPLDRDLSAGTKLSVVTARGDSTVVVVAKDAPHGQGTIEVKEVDARKLGVLEQGAEVYLRDVVWKLDPALQGSTPQWTLTNLSQAEIGAGQSIQIRITNLVSSLPSGYANLYVRYENFPGYWDGLFICPVEKAPAVYHQTRLGIGTTLPRSPVSVRAEGTAQELLAFEDAGGATRWHLNQNPGGKSGLNFAETNVADGRLYLKSGGSVGIGTTDPQAKLSVKGGVHVGSESDPGTGNLLVDGKVGIGDVAKNYLQRGFQLNIPLGPFKQYPSGNFVVNLNSSGLKIVTETSGVLSTNRFDVLTWYDVNGIPEVVVNGKLWAKEKYFLIEHPTKPGHRLAHSCLEGPEIGVYYRGTAELTDGEATVELPPYFEALTRREGRTVQLTAIGREPFRLSYEEVRDGRFQVYGSKPRGRFAWEVRAVRADVDELEVEPEG